MASIFVIDLNHSNHQYNIIVLVAGITAIFIGQWKWSWSTRHVSGDNIHDFFINNSVSNWFLFCGTHMNLQQQSFLNFIQQIYKTNRSRGGYALTELELPPIRARRVSTPSSVFASILNNIYACSSTFVQLYNEKYSRTTYMLMATWFASVFVFHGLTIYISEYSKEVEVNYYNRLTVSVLLTLIIFKTKWRQESL